jgi:hypothetical protein
MCSSNKKNFCMMVDGSCADPDMDVNEKIKTG